MRVEIDEKGRMVIRPETSIECYALSQWGKDAVLDVTLDKYGENCVVRGSSIFVHTRIDEEKA